MGRAGSKTSRPFTFKTGRLQEKQIPQVLREGYERMQASKRRGGQPGNVNALKHGQRSKRFTAERRARHHAEIEERHARERAWADAAPKTDYGAIYAAIQSTVATKH